MSIPIVDLFCGAGGLSLGLEQLGTTTALAIDSDALSVETIKANKSQGTIALKEDLFDFNLGSIRERAGITSDDFLIVGGPPCQPFSKNAYWTEKGDDSKYRKLRSAGIEAVKPENLTKPRDDNRRFLVDVFADSLEVAQPRGFIFENVASITHPRNKPTFERLLERFKSLGYAISVSKLSALSYGIAQKRERVIVMGIKGKFGPEIGEPTHKSSEKDSDDLLPTVTTHDVIGDLPFVKEEGIEVTGRWASALNEIPPGMNYKALTAWAGHPKPLFVAETKFWNFLLKLSPDLPSWTIASQPGPWTGPFHWENRRLTTPEMAVLQGFPADYGFQGPRRERVRQIGNAVPPKFISGVAKNLIGMI